MFISDVTCALDYEVANEFLEISDLPAPEFDDEPLPGGHMDIISDLGMGHMELEALCDDTELFPDEQLEASTYANRLPKDLKGRQCFILDPMLATGGTLIAAIQYLLDLGATEIIAICIIAAPEGIKAVEDAFPNTNVHLVTGAVDEKLNEHGYIVPGLGDAGDRLYGVV